MKRQSALALFLTVLMFALLVMLMLPTSAQVYIINTPTPSATFDPNLPTPLPTPRTCPTALDLTAGSFAYVRAGIIIRSEPTTSSAIMGYVAQNTDVVITEGPVCNLGIVWWKVRGTENPGWVAQSTVDDGQFVFSYGTGGGTDCVPDEYLSVGSLADILFDARIREVPSLEGRVRTVAPSGSVVNVVGGPECADGKIWWQVQATVVGFTYTGWMAEVGNGLPLLVSQNVPSTEDGTLCDVPLPFATGTRAFVHYHDRTPKYLRTAPGTDSTPLFTLVNNVPFIIEGGPVCRENLNWWRIRVLASQEVVGWMAEGSSGIGYWMRAIDPDEFGFVPYGLGLTCTGQSC